MGRRSTTSTRADLDELRELLADPAVWAEPARRARGRHRRGHRRRGGRGRHRPSPPPAPRSAGDTAAQPPHCAPCSAAAAAVAVLGRRRLRAASTGVNDDGGTEFSLEPTELVPGASGSGRDRQTDSGWRIEIDATGLPRLDDGRFYQAWLKDADDVLVPIGTFNEPRDVVLWAGVSPASSRRSRSPRRRPTATRRRPGAACSSAPSRSSPDSGNPSPSRRRTAGMLATYAGVTRGPSAPTQTMEGAMP